MITTGYIDMFLAGNPEGQGATSFNDPFDITDPAEEADKRIDYLFMIHDGGTVIESDLFLDTAWDISPGPEASWLWASDHIGVQALFSP